MSNLNERQIKVGEQIRRKLAQIIIEEEIFIDNSAITIIKTIPSPDLVHTKVYFRTQDQKYAEIIKKLLDAFSLKWSFQLMKELRLRKQPKLVFFYDDSFEEGQKIQEILNT
jgi:ribosome-binding factor A